MSELGSSPEKEAADEVALEMSELKRLLADYGELRARCLVRAPDLVEIAAAPALLHTFYNGIENILKRIALGFDGGVPEGASWHRELLDRASRPGSQRRPVISEAVRKRVTDYLEFRHVFRNLYVFKLDWEKMHPLVMNCQNVLEDSKPRSNNSCFLATSRPARFEKRKASRCPTIRGANRPAITR